MAPPTPTSDATFSFVMNKNQGTVQREDTGVWENAATTFEIFLTN